MSWYGVEREANEWVGQILILTSVKNYAPSVRCIYIRITGSSFFTLTNQFGNFESWFIKLINLNLLTRVPFVQSLKWQPIRHRYTPNMYASVY